jgi:hypothetical protein
LASGRDGKSALAGFGWAGFRVQAGMKKTAIVLTLVGLLIQSCVPKTVSAKGTTFRITISGGNLKKPLEITDPQVLAVGNIWSGQFLDDSRTPLIEEPKGLRAYEVSFYEKLAENDVRKMYVVYYYVGPAEGQSFAYLPREEPVWGLNVGTIFRKGLDGKWSYASPAWDALVKPLIAQAEKVDSSGSAADGGAPKIDELSGTSTVKINDWTKPQPGWLYILDPRSEADHPGSRVWLLDPETGKVKGSISAGYDPDFALSPDGSHLYVASGEREFGELAVIETASGTVVHIPFRDRVLYKPWYEGLPPFSRMVVSPDGRAVHIVVNHFFSPQKIGYRVWTFDTRSGTFLRDRVHLGNCGYGEFVLSSNADQFDFLCPTTNEIRFVRLDAEYNETSNTFVKLPWPRSCSVAGGFLSADSSKLAIVRRDGAIYEMNTTTQEFSAPSVKGDCGEWIVYPLQWPRSPDGEKIYLGYGPKTPDGTATSAELRIFDTTTWQQRDSFRTSVPFWSAVASKDGKSIFAIVPKEHGILAIDVVTLQEKRMIRVGITPALALVAP